MAQSSYVRLAVLLAAMLLAFPVAAQAPVTIFATATPIHSIEHDTNAVTLGVKFFSTVGGTISGIRFYRAHTNASGYIVKLFTTGGALLASARTAKDTCALPCWEQVSFAAPISISPKTTYIAAYYTSNGRYAADSNGLTNGYGAGPLYAQATGGNLGGNGVYTHSTGFPSQTYQNSNYWVDVLFQPTTPTLMLSFNPPTASLYTTSPPGTVLTTAAAIWSDGSPFTGQLSFAAPYGNDNGLLALSGNSIVVNGDLSTLGNTTQHITVMATQ